MNTCLSPRRVTHHLALLLFLLPLISFAEDAKKLDLLIENARIIIGDGTVLESASIGVIDDRIQWISTEGSDLREAAITINGDGMTVMPGLFDTHVHMIDELYSRNEQSLKAYMDVTLPHWLNGMLLHGVTTIRALGDPIEESLLIKRRVEQGQIVGPRIVASGPGLTHPKGHPFATMFHDYPDMHERFVTTSNDPDGARKIIRSHIKAGLDSPLKLVFHGGASEAEHYEFMGKPIVRLDPAVLSAAIDEAHKHATAPPSTPLTTKRP
jgi:imidazolonepropionase-like amidohydrolase